MEKSEKHLAALAYIRRGLPVFPTLADDLATPPDKLKRPRPGSHGFHDATRDERQIDAWWTENPNFNVAASPDDAGCCVLDIDGPEALAGLEIEFGLLPATVMARTQSGGLHIWFKGQLPMSKKRRPGVDVRGQTSYVLMPPSTIHGRPYTWIEKNGGVFAPLPENLKSVFGILKTDATTAEAVVKKDTPATIQQGREIARNHPLAKEGDRNNSAILVAYEIADFVLEQANVAMILHEEWNLKLNPPMPFDEIETLAYSGTRNRQNTPGVWAVPPPEELFKTLVANLPKIIAPPPKPSRFRLLDEAEQNLLPDPTWLIKDLIPDKSTVVLYAPSKAWKTFLALDWAMALVSGVDNWGTVNPGPVVYIAAEGATGLGKVRRPAWRLVHGIDKDRKLPFWVGPTMPWMDKPQEYVQLCDAIIAQVGKPKMIVLDTLARAMVGLDESSAKDASIAVETVENLKRALDCTVLVLHHSGKDAAKGMRGSSAFMAAFETGIELVTDKETMTAEVWAKWHKDAEPRQFPWTLKAEKVQGSLVFREATNEDLPIKDRLTIAEVGTALDKMKVYDPNVPCAEYALVHQLAQNKAWDQKKMTRVFKALVKTGKLEAYTVKPGWFYFPEAPSEF